MRILIIDHAGHPFQVELSRVLAGRGNLVRHCYTENLQTPRGDLENSGENANLEIVPISIEQEFARHGHGRRIRHEFILGRRLAREIKKFRPEAVISANMPLISQLFVQRAARTTGSLFVFWLQDILSYGIAHALKRRNYVLGSIVGALFRRLEFLLLRKSSAVVAISKDFVPELLKYGVDEKKIFVIGNWAPIGSLPLCSRNSQWACEHSLDKKIVVMYAGTLGLKHDPELLVAVGHAIERRESVELVVISEGSGAIYLSTAKSKNKAGRLNQLPFQPFGRLAEVLGSADILLAILEKDAGQYSIPSKILTYLCAGRAIVASMPARNLAARTIYDAGAGIVANAGDKNGFVRAVERLLDDSSLRQKFGNSARKFAERQFDIDRIADRFEQILYQRAL